MIPSLFARFLSLLLLRMYAGACFCDVESVGSLVVSIRWSSLSLTCKSDLLRWFVEVKSIWKCDSLRVVLKSVFVYVTLPCIWFGHLDCRC